LTRADLLEILGITGFVQRAPDPAPAPAPAPKANEGPLTRPYDSRERMGRGWPPLSDAQINTLNTWWGPGHNYNNVDGVEWSYAREKGPIGRGRKTYRRRNVRRKTKKHI
jgi:hypothetical protein